MPDLAHATRLQASSVASPGLACGTVWIIEEGKSAASGAAGTGLGSFELALNAARAELAQLQEQCADEQAATLLEFQGAMLEDESLLDPAWQAIDRGAAPIEAWQEAIGAQLAEFVDAEDAYFRARAADIADIRDRVLRHLRGEALQKIPPGSIVVARDLAPSLFLETDWRGGGIALAEGSDRSHVAMLARARSVPLLIGIHGLLARAASARAAVALLDGEAGSLTLAPDAGAQAEFAARIARAAALHESEAAQAKVTRAPATMRSGERVKLMINVADGSELEQLAASHFDGIGLVRTELLLRSVADLNDEERQFAAYSRMLHWAQGRPVTIRTLDAGADKPIPGYTIKEDNSFLGTRGVRLSLAAPGPLLIQLRAIARAATIGPVRIMVPMVTIPSELEAVRAVLDAAIAELIGEGVAHRRPELGMMVEVPLAALSLAQFKAQFVSIGSNDLIQYLTAASRESGRLAALHNPHHPAVLRLIREVVRVADARGLDVSLCGDMASDARCVAALLATGLRALSIAPSAEVAVRAAIAQASSSLTDTLSLE